MISAAKIWHYMLKKSEVNSSKCTYLNFSVAWFCHIHQVRSTTELWLNKNPNHNTVVLEIRNYHDNRNKIVLNCALIF